MQGLANEKLTARVHLLLMEKVAGMPDLTPFEDPCFHDELHTPSFGGCRLTRGGDKPFLPSDSDHQAAIGGQGPVCAHQPQSLHHGLG